MNRTEMVGRDLRKNDRNIQEKYLVKIISAMFANVLGYDFVVEFPEGNIPTEIQP